MLGLPYIKFIYILSLFLNKINKKILCFIFEIGLAASIIKGAYQQETLFSIILPSRIGFTTLPLKSAAPQEGS